MRTICNVTLHPPSSNQHWSLLYLCTKRCFSWCWWFLQQWTLGFDSMLDIVLLDEFRSTNPTVICIVSTFATATTKSAKACHCFHDELVSVVCTCSILSEARIDLTGLLTILLSSLDQHLSIIVASSASSASITSS